MPIYEVTLTTQATGLIEANSEEVAIKTVNYSTRIKQRLMDERGDDIITASTDITGDYDDDYEKLNECLFPFEKGLFR